MPRMFTWVCLIESPNVILTDSIYMQYAAKIWQIGRANVTHSSNNVQIMDYIKGPLLTNGF